MINLWCYLSGDKTVFRVSIMPTQNIAALMRQIYREAFRSLLTTCDPGDLILIKVDADLTTIKGSIGAGQYRPNVSGPSLRAYKKVSDVWPEQPHDGHLHVFVGLPVGMGSPTLIQDGGAMKRVAHPDRLEEYRQIFIKIDEWGNFKRSDIRRNKIRRMCDAQEDTQEADVVRMTAPHFVTSFERKLERKPRLQSMHAAYIDLSGPHFELPSMDPTSEDQSHEEARYAELSEVLHTAHHVAYYEWEKYWQKTRHGAKLHLLKEHAVKSIFFDPLIYAPRQEGTTTVLQDGAFPFHLVLECESVQPGPPLRKYCPRSDFLILQSSLPRLLVEVNSTLIQSWPPDLVRMLLMGASVVRFANKFVNAFRKEMNFVLCAIFIRDDGQATRYTIFQQQNDENVYYKEKRLSLNDSAGRVEFSRLLYNISCDVEVDEDQNRETKDAVSMVRATVAKSKLNSLHSDTVTTGRGSKRRRTDSRAGAAGGGNGNYGELRGHGYEVRQDVIFDDHGFALEPLYEMPSHILTVFRPSVPNKEFIAKKGQEGSHELEILKYLDTLQTKSDHVISLIDSFLGWSIHWLILPKMTSVDYYLKTNRQKLGSEAIQVCFGLIDGLAYLHKHCIAHRDIKPDNLLVDRDFCLKIIDFDIAMRVKDENEEVDDCRGTKTWMAPEVEMKLRHSPIKADRWTCGHVILFLLDKLRKEDRLLKVFARKLTAQDPKERPSLLGRCTHSSPLGNASETKAKRHRQDAMEVDGSTIPSQAKKHRF